MVRLSESSSLVNIAATVAASQGSNCYFGEHKHHVGKCFVYRDELVSIWYKPVLRELYVIRADLQRDDEDEFVLVFADDEVKRYVHGPWEDHIINDFNVS